IVCNESSIKEMPQLKNPFEEVVSSKYLIRDLRTPTNKTDYLIITHKDFLAAADSLASHKRGVGFHNPVVVLVDDIYRYFSGGDKDVAAIRNFIWYVASEWQGGEELNYVVLFGGGHFDSKNIITPVVDFIPVYIEGDDCIESFFTAILQSSEINYKFRPQIAIGRIPCRTIDQAWSVVNKIVQYENIEVADFGEWRNRAVFVADDDMQANRTDNVASTRPHHVSSDLAVAVVDSLWPSMDLRKIYMYEYEWDQLYQKPAAGKALINEINNGVAYVNFFGHGSEITWSDEYILTEGSITSMTNVKRYPFMSAFSCAVGRIDLPGKDCLSAALLLAKNAGAIGTLSSTREAYASSNEALAIRFYTSLLENSDNPRSIGMAWVDGIMRSLDNHRTYSILGDPSIKPVKPTHRVSISTNSLGDTIKALQTLIIKGSILSLDGVIDRSFTGNSYVAIGLFNPPYLTGRKDGGRDQKITYVLPGKPVFLGRTTVTNGEFSEEIVIPQNVTFNSEGVKIIAYAWKERERVCGVGYQGGLIFSGSESSADLKDTVGPLISIRPAYDTEKLSGGEVGFTDRVVVQTPVSCEIELFDENGIDVVGSGPDEGINIEIEGVMSRQNFNHKFQLKKGDFRRGVVSLYLEEDAINPGSYIMNVSARDMLGNLSKKSFTLLVTSDEIILDRVFNFPNPVRMGKETRFYCFTNFTMHQYFEAKINFTIKIYTLSGKPIRIIRNARNGEVWDLRDQMGNILGPDVYLYQIIVEDNSTNTRLKSVKSKIMKLVILPPR
ncbi:MAG: C25 family cysteine peptidase, partial [Chitinispirillaceae bacterium]|nr:C25 family cysteine peptidase [Chitinispirillaceae bacterium]